MGDGAGEVSFDVATFTDSCDKLFSRWNTHAEEEGWGPSDALAVISGSSQDDVITFPKSLALHAVLFQLELPDVLLVFTEKDVHMLASAKKAKIAQELADKLPESFTHRLHVLTRDKTDKDKANFDKIVEVIKGSKGGKRLGTLTKEKNAGAFAKAWQEALDASGLETADVQNGISDFLSVKSAGQLQSVKKAAEIGTTAFKKKVINKILDLVDEEDKKMSMAKLADQIEEEVTKVSKDMKLDENDVEVVLPPVVQSANGGFDLKYSAQVKEEPLHLPDQGVPAIHVASITLRYKFCSSTVARTLLFNARKDQTENYKILLAAFDLCQQTIKPGVALNKVYEVAAKHIKENKPDLLNNLHKELGWGIGYEIREKRLVLDEKNKHKFHSGQVFCLRLGLENLQSKQQAYSLLIADTLIVTEDGSEVVTTTPKKQSKVSWNVSDEQDEEQTKTEKKEKKKPSEAEIKRAMEDKFGAEKTRHLTESEETDKQKQFEERNKELALRRVEEQKKRFNKELGGTESKAMSHVSGYNGPQDFPMKASGMNLCVDDGNSTILVPINGQAVPFHVSTIKNIGIQQQGAAGTVLRVNFVSPGAGIKLSADNKTLMYLRELSFRAQESHNMMLVHKQINDMKKAFNAAEKEKQARDELVPQEALRLNPNRGPRLQTLKIYPNLQARGKKTEGDLEAHLNGFRFTVRKAAAGDVKHVDILYRNIKHAFFQLSNKASTLILLHFRLKNPIMVGKNSTKDIQFFVEWMDDGESLVDNRRKNMHDRDEFEEENRMKEMKNKLDNEFKKFCDRVQDILPPDDPNEPDGDKIWEWDVPYLDLEFQGNPKSSMVELYPTVNCIVHLATKPVCIIELDSVDLAYYERVRGGNTNFDITFVFKQFLDEESKIADCWTRITAIDMKYYDNVKEVLQKSKLVQFEGTTQVNWNLVLKDYIKNFEDISKDGGWEVIFGNDPDEEDDDDEDEDDDDFKGSGSGSGSSEEESESEYSSGEPEDSDDYSEEELSDEGMDSDEAERWADEEDDRERKERKEKEARKGGSTGKRGRDDDSDDDRPKKKSGGMGSGKKGGSLGKKR